MRICVRNAVTALLAGSLGIWAAASAAQATAQDTATVVADGGSVDDGLPPAVVTSHPHVMPTRQGAAGQPHFLTMPEVVSPAVATGNGIDYHGGRIMGGTVRIYLIFYGNWAGNTGTTLIPALIQGLSGSPYYNINHTYSDSTGAAVQNSLQLARSITDNYSHGAAITDNGVVQIVNTAISTGQLPLDTGGLYFVLTSPDVRETSGFCTVFCGFHNHATIAGSDIKYSFVGNAATQCPNGCIAQSAASPNNNVGVDGMASVISHELSEAVTDPDLNAWFQTSSGEENGDLCNFNFGTTFRVANGSAANQTLGGRNFLIQQMWLNAQGGRCTQHFP
jgi:hypothetical protein